ncbi:malectin domain-containing carbohydrate-binding protein [Luteolibacter sp. Populi]|uniref:malectin domain-containing carbohydrate-binding protein n=1 Tax=Luteolibacter sp. Populi TaxID=3230487 RepID=UPI0034666E4C
MAEAQSPAPPPVAFSFSRLVGLRAGANNKGNKVTSLQFGPDGKLYYVQENGTVWHCNVTRQGPNNYVADALTPINLVKLIPNYDDDGTLNTTLHTRQATGLMVSGTAESPVIYVTSSDPRVGAGSAGDLNLDTNSGVISRLTKNGANWEKVDIVRGLPRSEENHAVNGLSFDPTGTKLLLAVGGSTNAGGPSNNFAFACEDALSAAVLSIDIAAIEAMPILTDGNGTKYIYDLPTVNDPNPARADAVPGSADHADVNDPFGGNDGLNQAKLVPGGPVQIFSSGFRNPYDVLVATTPGRAGKIYTIDNAGNPGWGGYPKNEGTANVTNEYQSTEPGTVNNLDSLQRISQGYYGGHPNPIRANPAGAGWLHLDGGPGGAGLVYSASPTIDWPPVPVSMADPQQGDFRLPGPANNALMTFSSSTCGIAEYTAGNFGGAMVGNIITAQFNGGTPSPSSPPKGAVRRIVMNEDGTQALSSSIILEDGLYGSPLDIAIPGPGTAPALAGTIFVAHYLGLNEDVTESRGITILEPTDFDNSHGICNGTFSYTLDEDNDGYSNADESLNGSEPCSPAVRPGDADRDFLSDLLDTDDDNDGIADNQDAFPIDPRNGINLGLPVDYDFFISTHGFYSLGFTGVMLDPGTDYSARLELGNIVGGGTSGVYTPSSIGAGTPLGSANSAMNAFQIGVNIDQSTGPFRLISGLGGLLFSGTPTAGQSQGIFMGNGDQDNYVKVAVNANNGAGAIEIVHEENGVVLTNHLYPEPGLLSATPAALSLSFLVDPISGSVQPGYAIGTGNFINVGPPIIVGGKILDVLHGSSGMAFGLLASTGGEATPSFEATWDFFKVLPIASTASAKLTVNSNAGSITNSSTNTTGSFQLENTSTGGQKIVSAKIDLSTALLPDIVFDPAGTAGDLDGKAFQLDSFNGTGTPVGIFESPHDGIGSQDGFNALKVECGPGVVFGPGNLLTFSSDVDPTSVKGVPGPGPSHSASVSGLELIGATFTVTFDDGTVQQIRNGGFNGTNGNKTSIGVAASGNLPTPGIAVPGKVSPFITNSQPTVRVTGPAGDLVEIWTFNTAFYLDGVANGGYDIDPFEANSVIAYGVTDAVVGGAGYVDVPVTLSSENGGINYVAALMIDEATGKRSSSSKILTIDYDPNFTNDAMIRVNAGGLAFTDSLGHVWAADNGWSSGNEQTYANEIAGTVDDILYQDFRFDDSPSTPLDYSFSVPNGNYQVKLHFAETWSGVTAPGIRVFDVLLENAIVLDDFDPFAVAGSNTAHVETFDTNVSDGQLTIGLRKVVQNPFISAIEVFYLGGGSGPDTSAPLAPPSFAATNLKAGSLTLNWLASFDNVGVTGYRVFREGSDLGTTTATTFAQVGLTPETEYDFEIEAFDAAGHVSPRSTLTVTTPADAENPTIPVNLKGSAGNQSATLAWLAASDDAAVTGYRIYRDGNLLTTVTTLNFSESGLENGTNYTYQVIAIDATGKTSPPATAIVRPRAIAGVVFRMDTGTPNGVTAPTIDSLGNEWVVDTGYFNAGLPDGSTRAIAGTVDDVIYRSRRYDTTFAPEMKYTFPVANGDYELRLHFAETTLDFQTGVQKRIFDVKVQNQLAIDDLDIVATVGFTTALVIPVPATVTNGSLTVEFLHSGFNNPCISGIELYALVPPPPDTQAPTAPGSLAVSDANPGSISLAWTASADNVAVTGYHVSRDGGAPSAVTGLSFTDTGLLPGTLHSYSVKAVDAAGNLSTAATVDGSTLPDVTAPSTPGSLVGTPGNGTAGLTWTASTDNGTVTGYRIYRDGFPVETVGTLNYNAVGLTNETAYVFGVAAIDGSNNESLPAQVTVTPRALGAAIYRIDCGNITADYVDPFGVTWAKDLFFNTSPLNVSEGSAPGNTITGTSIPEIYKTYRSKNRNTSVPLKYEFPVTNGTYEVRLHFAETATTNSVAGIGSRVFNVLLEGGAALPNLDVFAQVGRNVALVKVLPATIADGKVTLDFTVGSPVAQNPFVSAIEIFPVLSGAAAEGEPPATPGPLQESNLTGNSVTLGWAASTDNIAVAGYRIYRNGVLVNTVTTLSFNDASLTPGTLYHYSVVAFDAAGNVSLASTRDVTTLAPDITPPSVPGNLVATPGLGQVALTWDASTDIVGVTGYRVIRNGSLVTTVPTPGYIDTGLANATLYSYDIVAVDAAINLSVAAQTSTTTLADTGAPETPGGLEATPDFTTVTLAWDASTDNVGVIGYRVYRGIDLLDTVTTLGFEDAGLTPGTPYHYEVRAIDLAGNASAPASVDTTTPADTQAPAVPVGFAATPGDGSVALGWTPSGDNVGVTGYQISRNSAVIATVPTPGYSDTGLTNGTLYTYEVRALDASNNLSAAAAAAATPRVIGANVVRIDAGATASFTDSLGRLWAADSGFNSSGFTTTVLSDIQGTTDDAIYQSERYDSTVGGGNLGYSWVMPDGQYEVRLHLAETYAAITAPGQRVFDLKAEGAIAVDDLDIFARAGSNHALVVTFPVTVADGILDLEFIRGVQNPKICGIEVYTIQSSGEAVTFAQWLTSHGLSGQTDADSDGGHLDNLSEFELQMDPNDPSDDLEFTLKVAQVGGIPTITLPGLKPIGNYYVHRASDLADIGNIANRIDVITKAEIELMSPAARANYVIEDNAAGSKAFYRLFFEPVAE